MSSLNLTFGQDIFFEHLKKGGKGISAIAAQINNAFSRHFLFMDQSWQLIPQNFCIDLA